VTAVAVGGCAKEEHGCLGDQDCPEGQYCRYDEDLPILQDLTGECRWICSLGDDEEVGDGSAGSRCVEDSDCNSQDCNYDGAEPSCTCVNDGTGGTGGSGGTGGTAGGGGTAASCATACPDRMCVEISDDTFADAEWEVGQVSAGGVTGYSVSQGTDGAGNPDPYRWVSHEVGVDSQIWVGHDKVGNDYSPSLDGAIHSLHYSLDGRALQDSRQVAFRPLAKQDGQWFWTKWTSYVLINEGDWVTKQWPNVTLEPAGSGELDLTIRGAPITFGFSTGASHTGPDAITREAGVDNWRVVICKE